MTEKETYEAAGIRHQWCAVMGDATEIREFNPDGSQNRLDSVDWENAVAIVALPIEGGDPKDAKASAMLGYNRKPVWFHRSKGLLNGVRFEAETTTDVIGYEEDGVRVVTYLEADGTSKTGVE